MPNNETNKDLREQLNAIIYRKPTVFEPDDPEDTINRLEALITKQVNEARIDELLSCRMTANENSRTKKWIDIRFAELQTGDKDGT